MAKKLPIYLYTGPEFGLRNDALDELKADFIKKTGTVDEHSFFLIETPLNEVMTILQNGTLFSDGVFIVCKNAELIKKKDEIQMISDWLKNPDETTALVLISDEISVDAKLEKLVPPENRKKFWEMYEDKKVPWLINFFKKNEYFIQTGAAELILEMVENNTQELKAECSRFFYCFPKGTVIDEEKVEAVLTHNREENAFTLFAQLADSTEESSVRLEKSLQILQKIRLSKENSSVMIIAGLASCFRKLSLWHNFGETAITKALMQKQYRSAAKIWTVGQTAAILAVLAKTDMEIRSPGGAQIEDLLLQKMLYEITIKKGASIATAEFD
ncbi:MAG: DNA polymerase III subunit delta [Treponema sp.]|nr:DNA polymerase III subunit delta [Treponema sp.]